MFTVLFAIMAVATLVVLGLVFRLMGTLQEINSSQEQRHQSYLLADELRQRSDDLTRMART